MNFTSGIKSPACLREQSGREERDEALNLEDKMSENSLQNWDRDRTDGAVNCQSFPDLLAIVCLLTLGLDLWLLSE